MSRAESRRRVRLAGVIATMLAMLTLGSMGAVPSGADVVIHPLTFGSPVVLNQSGTTGSAAKTCYNPCGEPSMAIAPDGTIYVSTPRTLLLCCNTKSSPVWKSTDGGTTWSNPIFPSAPVNNNLNAFTGGDTELAIDKRGTVYEGELWLGSDSMYTSSDKGTSWNWSPVSHDVLDDREWLVYSQKEDALWGIYDAIKGLEVIKIPLNGPLGTDQALFATDTRVVVPEWNDCPGILAGPCIGKPDPVPDEVNGVPVTSGLTSPGRPSVDQNDGTAYFPFPYQVAGKGVGIAMTSDGGTTYQYRYVTGAGHGVFGDTGNDFPVSAVDTAGNLYVAWAEDKGSGFTIYLSISKDKGLTWTGPFAVSSGISGTAIFPNISAGAPGRVAVSWMGTPDIGDANALTDSVWDVDAAVTLNALDAQPTFEIATVHAAFHKGAICTHGSGCVGDSRKLLDFFDQQIDASGALLLVYARDKLGHPGASGTDIAFSRQTEGCSLTQPGVVLGPGVPAPDGTPLTLC